MCLGKKATQIVKLITLTTLWASKAGPNTPGKPSYQIVKFKAPGAGIRALRWGKYGHTVNMYFSNLETPFRSI